jgi:hypothetical protein
MGESSVVGAVVIAAVFAAACGGGEDSPDARRRPDAGVDAGVDATPPPCTVSTMDFGAVTIINPLGLFQPGNTGDVIDDIVSAGGRLEQDPPHDSLVVELFGGVGGFAGQPITPGTYQIAGADLQFQTCGICFRVFTNVSGNSYADDYLATAGTVTITTVPTAAGQTLALSASQLTFEHVTIDMVSSESAPAGDGCTTAVASVAYDVTAMALPARIAPAARRRSR